MQHGDHFLTSVRAVFGMTKVKCLTGVVSGKDEGENLKIAKFSHTSKLLLFFPVKEKENRVIAKGRSGIRRSFFKDRRNNNILLCYRGEDLNQKHGKFIYNRLEDSK